MNYKKIVLKLSCLFIFLSLSFLFSDSVFASADTCICVNKAQFAADDLCNSGKTNCNEKCATANSTFASCLSASDKTQAATPQTLPNPLGITDVNAFIAQLINFVLSLVGSVSLLLFVYGGITWMTSAGASAQVKKGKDIVVWAVIGLAVVFTSYILVKFVIQGITGA